MHTHAWKLGALPCLWRARTCSRRLRSRRCPELALSQLLVFGASTVHVPRYDTIRVSQLTLPERCCPPAALKTRACRCNCYYSSCTASYTSQASRRGNNDAGLLDRWQSLIWARKFYSDTERVHTHQSTPLPHITDGYTASVFARSEPIEVCWSVWGRVPHTICLGGMSPVAACSSGGLREWPGASCEMPWGWMMDGRASCTAPFNWGARGLIHLCDKPELKLKPLPSAGTAWARSRAQQSALARLHMHLELQHRLSALSERGLVCAVAPFQGPLFHSSVCRAWQRADCADKDCAAPDTRSLPEPQSKGVDEGAPRADVRA